jgi:hypothetical protein
MEIEKQDQPDWTPPFIGIPAEVFGNPKLTQTEKFLFGFLQNLSLSERGCFASNSYLGTLIMSGAQTVSNSIQNLKKYKYINVVFKDKDGPTKETERHIYINPNYKVLYRQLAIEFYKNHYKLSNNGLLNKLEEGINQIIGGYSPVYTEEDSYNNSKETINSKELIQQSDSQIANSNSNTLDKQSKHSLIRTGMAKAKVKDKPVDKPLNGPYKKIFDYWQLSGLRKPNSQNSTYEKNVIALRGLFNGTAIDRKYTIDEIVKVIDLLKLAASPDYTPPNLKSKEYYRQVYFCDFVYNSRTGKSLFKELLDNPPKLLKESVKPIADPDPEITNYLLTSYQEKAMGRANVDFLKDEKNKSTFKLANLYLQKFWKANLNNFTCSQGTNTLAKHLIKAFENIIEDKHNGDTTKWELWWFRKEDYIFDILGKYLYSQALMK